NNVYVSEIEIPANESVSIATAKGFYRNSLSTDLTFQLYNGSQNDYTINPQTGEIYVNNLQTLYNLNIDTFNLYYLVLDLAQTQADSGIIILTNNRDFELYNASGSGSGLNVNGTNNYLQAQNNTDFGFEKSDSFSVEFWVKSPSNGIYETVMGK